MLCGLKEFRRDNLQVQQHLGSAIAAAEYAGIGEVADDTPDAGVVPHLTRPCPIPELIQIGGDPLGSVASCTYLSKIIRTQRLGLVDNQLHKPHAFAC